MERLFGEMCGIKLNKTLFSYEGSDYVAALQNYWFLNINVYDCWKAELLDV